MTEIKNLKLPDLLKLRKSIDNGINVPIQTQYTNDGLMLRNNKNGKDYLFRFNKVFAYANKFAEGESCFIHYTKANTTYANKARFKNVSYSFISDEKRKVNGYPFDVSQLSFLSNEMLQGKELTKFAKRYINVLIKYKEDDGEEGESMNPDDMSFLDDIVTPRVAVKSQTKTKEGKKMNTLTNAAEKAQEVTARAIQINKEAAILAAKLEVGNVAVQQIKNQIKVPWLMKGYKNHPLFDIALANVVGVALRELAPDNEKAQVLSEAMVQSAVVQMTQSFNINDMVNDLVKNIDLSKLVPSKN